MMAAYPTGLCYAVIILFAAAVNFSQAQAQSVACDFSDTFGCVYIADGVCDNIGSSSVCLTGTDCYDCDDCQIYNGECGLCTQNNCYYCPSDARCLSQPITEAIWAPVRDVAGSRLPGCLVESEWQTTCEIPVSNPFLDPLYSAQEWVFDIMNVQPVWEQGITGKGVVVRVNDPEGVDATHRELAANFDVAGSCDQYLPPDPSVHRHGTSVASIAVGGGSNGQCAVGVAPDATLTACLGPTALTDENAAAFFLDGLATTHISVNSWNFDSCSPKFTGGSSRRFLQETCPFFDATENNPCTRCPDFFDPSCEDYLVTYCKAKYEEEYSGCAEFLDLFVVCGYNVLSEVGQSAITRGITEGRYGLGIIYVFAAGNEYNRYEDVNTEGWLNSRFTIVVGAVGKNSKHASYSSTGAAIFVSAPGGDKDTFGNYWTALAGGGCFDASYGTSYATPAVSGGIALMLEANPGLGWRDVQGIIASTSRLVDIEEASWVTNAAFLQHSNLYGFGIFNARAAVEAAKKWVNFGPEKQVVAESGVINLQIADDASRPSASKVTVTTTQSGAFTVESIIVYLQLEHESRGDLEIVLTSPHGTPSTLHPPNRPEKQQLSGAERWKLMTVVNYGESLAGDWTLTLTDKSPGNLGVCVDEAFQNLIQEADGSTSLMDCQVLEVGGSCANRVVLADRINGLADQNGQFATDACCACGGGSPVSDVNVLVSWRMLAYGHETLPFNWTPDEAETLPLPPNGNTENTESSRARTGQLVVTTGMIITLLSIACGWWC